MYVVGYTSSSRITGMASGMDIDQIVADLMMAEKVPLDTAYQQKQLEEWKMEEYRSIITKVKAFEDKYFNASNTASNMMSKSSYIQYAVDCSGVGVLTATANAQAKTGVHTVKVDGLATAASFNSSTGVSKNIQGSLQADFEAAKGKRLQITVDGVEKTIAIDGSVMNTESLQAAVDEAIGVGKIIVGDSNGDGTGYLTIEPALDSGVQNIDISGSSIDVLEALGFGEDSIMCNRLNTSSTLEEVSDCMNQPFEFDSNGNVAMVINGKLFEFDKDMLLEDMMDEINRADISATIEYDEITDRFLFTAGETGAGNTLEIEEFGSTFLTSGKFTRTEGSDAHAVIDGQKITRSDNVFTIDGITYSLTGASSEVQTVSVTQDIDSTYELIVQFVDDYNSLIDNLNKKVGENYDRDYPPLTQEQKAEMSESEIEDWEERAKTGLLSGDSLITGMLREMRMGMYEPVEGINLAYIGITTSSKYEDKGKLVIDQDKLIGSIQNDPQKVMDLFCKEEEGLMFKIDDILEKYASTYMDSNGNKGFLIEKAGLEGDTMEYNNFLYESIKDYEERMDELSSRLEDKEEYYYSQFSMMEKYINEMNAQLEYIQSLSS